MFTRRIRIENPLWRPEKKVFHLSSKYEFCIVLRPRECTTIRSVDRAPKLCFR